MCGIIAVLRRLVDHSAASSERTHALVTAASKALATEPNEQTLQSVLMSAGESLTALDQELRGIPGLLLLLRDNATRESLTAELTKIEGRIRAFEAVLDSDDLALDAQTIEIVNALFVTVKDAHWAASRDRIPHAASVAELCSVDSPEISVAAATALSSVQAACSALDRLEVRGRDSAGLSLLVTGIDANAETVRGLLAKRPERPLFTDRAVRVTRTGINLVYKAAAEIGELGDNVRNLRGSMREDTLLQELLRQPGVEIAVLGHTRWASVGVISEPNAHPLNHEETSPESPDTPYVLASLNGDVDNHEDLVSEHDLQIDDEITTDAKVIPTLVSRRMASGQSTLDAFRETVASFEGSVAIGAATAREPGKIQLALRGSGQALYIGISDDMFLVSSEPYGVVEESQTYLRMDGETPGNPANPSASRGQVLVLDREHAGSIEGMQRQSYDGTELPIEASNLATAAITTRDIDRGSFPHFLLKEITEAPRSMRKTLRGRVRREDDKLRVIMGETNVPADVRKRLGNGDTRRVIVIGQGTAAVAGQGVAAALAETLERSPIQVEVMPATEMSGFKMREDMSDTLIIAISQSGTTTDTNRTVDLVRSRGARVLAIVNRRGSDLTDKADGVLYTSDGRDIEMSVASTKAFYAQIAAGWLLALDLANAANVGDPDREHALLQALVDLPDDMGKVLKLDPQITAAAEKFAPQRRYWALVGNGKNLIAAEEVRIKLSELCYKSIACDATEDKKHIDLSSEPLVLVCAAGLTGSTADDVAKEVAIYKAHKASPLVIATEGEGRFRRADAVFAVPSVHPSLAFVLSTMAGHLFGYRAALAIDQTARVLREARAAIELAATAASKLQDGTPDAEATMRRLHDGLRPRSFAFRKAMADGKYDGSLEAGTAVRLASLFNYATGLTPLDSYAIEYAKPGAPGQVLDDLVAALTKGIDELTRPVDAIKHQAKTVTVGISRSDEAVLTVPLVKALFAAGTERERVSYRDLSTLADLDSAVARVVGSTRYAITGDLVNHIDDPDGAGEEVTITVAGRTGIAREISSRTDRDPRLRGTKHMVAFEKSLTVAKGRSDGRIVILVPELTDGHATGLLLLHVELHDKLAAAALRGVLAGYRNRYAAIRDAVTETEPEFVEATLETITIADLLTQPVHLLAEHWRVAATS